MKYLWDTDICIHLLNGNKTITQKLQDIGVENICTSIINILELKFGAYNSAKVEPNLERIKKLKSKLAILNYLEDDIADFFAKTKAHLKRIGVTISDFDLLIAGFAKTNDLVIVTNNTKHFKHIPDLKIENWLEE